MYSAPSGASATARAPKTPARVRRPTVAVVPRLAGAGERADDAGGQIDDAHPMIGDIGDE